MTDDAAISYENPVRRLVTLDTETVARILDRDGTLSPVDALRRVDFNVARDIAQALVDERIVTPAERSDT